MRRKYGTTRIFAEKELRDYLEQQKAVVIRSIESEKDDYLLNVNERDFVSCKMSEAYVEPLQIHEDQIYASTSEQMVLAKYFPAGFRVTRGQSNKKEAIKFHVPFAGNSALLFCMPSSRILWSMDIEISGNEFCFEILNSIDDVASIKRDLDSSMRNIMQQLGNIVKEVERYNAALEPEMKQAFVARRQRIVAKSGVLSTVSVPIIKADGVPSTFSVPTLQTRKKISVSRPGESGFKTEPALDNYAYQEILKIINDVGKEFERLPSLYAGQEEEHLRDHFLMMLEPNFKGTASGETFNKTGKTDILLRYGGSNVFIAECKFWRGQKAFLVTLSQLLGCLTWQDSKAAVIIFVPNKDFSSVIETVKTSITRHPHYLESNEIKEERWFSYTFHLNDERNRLVRLAVMLYHTPRKDSTGFRDSKE